MGIPFLSLNLNTNSAIMASLKRQKLNGFWCNAQHNHNLPVTSFVQQPMESICWLQTECSCCSTIVQAWLIILCYVAKKLNGLFSASDFLHFWHFTNSCCMYWGRKVVYSFSPVDIVLAIACTVAKLLCSQVQPWGRKKEPVFFCVYLL